MVRIAASALIVFAAAMIGVWQGSGPEGALARGMPATLVAETAPSPLSIQEIAKIENYLRRRLANSGIRVLPRAPEAEIFIGEEYLGIVYPEELDGERTFFVELAILNSELSAESVPAGSRR